MKKIKTFFFLLTAGFGLALSNTAFADPKPKGAKSASAQTVANHYAGKTHHWKSCKGGIYFGANWQAQAYCNKEGPSIGLGKWSVTKRGKICHELTWYWPKGDGHGSKVDKKDCTEHVVDANGEMWRSWQGEKDWWRSQYQKNLEKGFKHKSKINRLRKKLKL